MARLLLCIDYWNLFLLCSVRCLGIIYLLSALNCYLLSEDLSIELLCILFHLYIYIYIYILLLYSDISLVFESSKSLVKYTERNIIIATINMLIMINARWHLVNLHLFWLLSAISKYMYLIIMFTY